MLDDLKQIQELVMKLIAQLNEPTTKYSAKYFEENGRKGGEMLKEQRGKDYYSAIGKKGAEARKNKK